MRNENRNARAKLVRTVRVDGSMEQCVTTGRRGLRSRSKPTRSPIAELTRRTIGRPDLIKGRWTLCSIDPFLAQVCECGRAAARIPMGEVLRPRPWESDIRYRYVGVVWRGFTPPSRRSRAGKEEVPPPMTRSNLDHWEDCGEAPQGTSLAQLRSNVLARL